MNNTVSDSNHQSTKLLLRQLNVASHNKSVVLQCSTIHSLQYNSDAK